MAIDEHTLIRPTNSAVAANRFADVAVAGSIFVLAAITAPGAP
ncbi:hypothetical protein [Nocardia sp. CA-135398]